MADAWAVILERGCSESFIAQAEKLDELKPLRPALRKWLDSDSGFAIVALPIQKGDVQIRTAYLDRREDLPKGIEAITGYLSARIGDGKQIAWAQGGELQTETKEIIQLALGTLPGPWALH